jgi:hypothetical protein
MNMRNRVSICTLIIGLICPFTQVARGQQSGPVQSPPATMVEGFKEAPEAFRVGRGEMELACHRFNFSPVLISSIERSRIEALTFGVGKESSSSS